MTYAILGSGLLTLTAGLLALMFRAQRDYARALLDGQRLIAEELRRRLDQTTADAQDSWLRSSKTVMELKKQLAERTKELDEYAAKDPRLAGARLDRVLSQSTPPADAPAAVSGKPPAGGKSG